MSVNYVDDRQDRLKQLQRELKELQPSLELAREQSRAAERKIDDLTYKCKWMRKRLLEAETEAEFDDLLDQLHKAEDACKELVRKRLVADLADVHRRREEIEAEMFRIQTDLTKLTCTGGGRH